MKTDKNNASMLKKIIVRLAAVSVIAAVLTIAYFSGDDVKPPADSVNSSDDSSGISVETTTEVPSVTDPTSEQSTMVTVTSKPVTTTLLMSSDPSETDKGSTTVTTTVIPVTLMTTKPQADPQTKTCSFMISCTTVFDNKDKLRDGIIDILPHDGIIFPKTDVPIQEGDTVYTILKRICNENKIHIETTKIAATNSYYIEGIANLYEFDAGNLSGWMYSVDGKFPQISTSMYKLHGGENVEIVYSCNIGVDVGDDYFKKAG